MEKNYRIEDVDTKLLLHPCNEWVCNWYYLVHGYIINEDYSDRKEYRFVVWFDNEDIAAFVGDGYEITDEDMNDYVAELAMGYFDLVSDFEDLSKFYEACNKSIRDYNVGVTFPIEENELSK